MKLEAKSRLLASASAAHCFSAAAIARAAKVDYKSRTKLIEMPISDFLVMAEIGEPGKQKTDDVEALLDAGTKFSDLPYLRFDSLPDGNWKCYAHEGRHRARALLKRGYKTMPVLITGQIRWSEQSDPSRFDYHENWPKWMIGENSGKHIPFPVSRSDAANDYHVPG